MCEKNLLEYPVAAIVSHDMINSIIENAYEKTHTQRLASHRQNSFSIRIRFSTIHKRKLE